MLSAQTTREQADVIVQDYLKKEAIQSGLLYVHVNAPSDEDIVITTSNEETVKVKYACWIYFLNENELAQSRYFFVKEINGSLLEIIASNDLGPDDVASWKVVEKITGINDRESNIKLFYPNPVDDWLIFPCAGNNTRIEIYDLKGTRLFSELLSGENACQLSISFLNTGIYMVNVAGEIYKIIKN